MKPDKPETNDMAARERAKAKAKTMAVALSNWASVAMAHGNCCARGMPMEEAGPRAWEIEPFADKRLITAALVLRLAVCQLTRHGQRHLFNARCGAVVVIADRPLIDHDKVEMTCTSSIVVGSYTEAKRTVEEVRWVYAPGGTSLDGLVKIAAGELRCYTEEDEKNAWTDVLFIVWKDSPVAWEGKGRLAVAEAIRDRVLIEKSLDGFVEAGPRWSAAAEDDDDDEGEEWKQGEGATS